MEAKKRLECDALAVETFPTTPEPVKAGAGQGNAVELDAEALAATSRPIRPPYCTC